VFSIVVIILAVLATIGTGIYIDGYVIHPPAQYTGVCAPPAQISGKGCYITEIQQIEVSGTATVTTISISTGYIVLPGNGTAKH
jgi:hypothetical protein